MTKVDSIPLKNILEDVELVLKNRRLDKAFYEDLLEEALTKLLTGSDPLNPYERRESGVKDEEWSKKLKTLRVWLKLEIDSEEVRYFTF